MKIYVINMKKKMKYFYAIVILMTVIFVVGVSQADILEVFSQNKELPIYSVDIPEKSVSITFDWRLGRTLI